MHENNLFPITTQSNFHLLHVMKPLLEIKSALGPSIWAWDVLFLISSHSWPRIRFLTEFLSGSADWKVSKLSADQYWGVNLSRPLSFQPVWFKGDVPAPSFLRKPRHPHLNIPFPLLESSVPGYIEPERLLQLHFPRDTTQKNPTNLCQVRLKLKPSLFSGRNAAANGVLCLCGLKLQCSFFHF